MKRLGILIAAAALLSGCATTAGGNSVIDTARLLQWVELTNGLLDREPMSPQTTR